VINNLDKSEKFIIFKYNKMELKVVYSLVFLILSLISVYWSTNLQTQCDISSYKSLNKYFLHSRNAGSVCLFGIYTGRLICLFILMQVVLFPILFKQEKYSEIKKLLYMSISVVSLVFVLSLLMNSGLNNYLVNGSYKRGLFENNIPYFVTQIISIILIWKSIPK